MPALVAAALGAHVVIVGRNEEKLQKVRAEIVEDGGRIETRACDIRDEAQVLAVIDGVLQRFTTRSPST